jgi:cytochrome c554/c'-like protein
VLRPGSLSLLLLSLPAVSALASGCGNGSSSAPSYLSRDALLDPQTCTECHKAHYDDWSGSMHAYASDDPIFLAMNKRGQRETNGQLGSFCVKCHAPMALHEGATTDGQNLASVPQKLHGVTCFFCHTVASVQGSHNDPLVLANDITMRGEYTNPVANHAHPAAYSDLIDRDKVASAQVCGSCHDIVTTMNAAIERTYSEWQQSIFGLPNSLASESCGQCHMAASTTQQPIAQVSGLTLPNRYVHSHVFPAVDAALTPNFPNAAANQATLQTFLDSTLQTALCVVQPPGNASIRVIVDNVASGHGVTSGAAQDRRLWAEVIAYSAGQVIYQSGVVPQGMSVTSLTSDPDLWLVRDCMLDAQSKPVDMFWQAAGYETNLLPYPVTIDQSSPLFYKTHVKQYYPRNPTAALPAMPDKVTLRLRLQPIGLDVLEDLVTSGDLDPAVMAAAGAQTLVFPETMLTWTAATANATTREGPSNEFPVSCISTTLPPTLVEAFVNADTTTAVNHMKCSP